MILFLFAWMESGWNNQGTIKILEVETYSPANYNGPIEQEDLMAVGIQGAHARQRDKNTIGREQPAEVDSR